MPMKPKLSVVILCYRGEESIIPFIEQLERELQGDGLRDYELVLVGNYFKGCNDSTPEIVKELARKNTRIVPVTLEKRGMMGWDVITGFKHASGEAVTLIDGDGQMPPKDIVRLYHVLESGEFDFVKTYRVERYDSLYRKVISNAYNYIFKILFPRNSYRDINSKPKLWKRSALEKMNLKCNGWFSDGEMILEANFHKFIFAEIPTVFQKNEWRASFVKIRTIFEILFMMLYYRIKYWLK